MEEVLIRGCAVPKERACAVESIYRLFANDVYLFVGAKTALDEGTKNKEVQGK